MIHRQTRAGFAVGGFWFRLGDTDPGLSGFLANLPLTLMMGFLSDPGRTFVEILVSGFVLSPSGIGCPGAPACRLGLLSPGPPTVMQHKNTISLFSSATLCLLQFH